MTEISMLAIDPAKGGFQVCVVSPDCDLQSGLVKVAVDRIAG